jgi:hypothetical protein
MLVTFLITSCKESVSSNNTEISKNSSKTKKLTNNDLLVSITFSDGPLKGTHKFVKEKGKMISSNTVGYLDETTKNPNQRNSTTLSASALISEDGKLKLQFLTKYFKGKITEGNHEPVYIENSGEEKYCTTFTIKNNGHSFNFNRMFSKNETCNTTEITGFSDWKEGTVMNRRNVSGNFTDTFELEFNDKDGKNVKKVTSEIKVTFTSREQKMKSSN